MLAFTCSFSFRHVAIIQQQASSVVEDVATRPPRLLVRSSKTTTTRDAVMSLTAAVSPEEAPSAEFPPSLLGWAQPLTEAPRWVHVSPLALAVEPGGTSQLLLTYSGEIGNPETVKSCLHRQVESPGQLRMMHPDCK